MARVSRGDLGAGLVAIALFLSVAGRAEGQVQHAARSGDEERMARAADRVVVEGVEAHLPPNLSHLLGLSSAGQECVVMQRAMRTGKLVQGFDVPITNFENVVIFVVDESSNDQALYLASRRGTLRRVVSVKGGVGAVRAVTSQDRKAFEKEKRFWLDQLAPAAKP